MARSPKQGTSTIQYAGATPLTDLPAWLGADLEYQPQVAGDLGDRLIHSFQVAFGMGARLLPLAPIVPALPQPCCIKPLLPWMNESEVVLGPAIDFLHSLLK